MTKKEVERAFYKVLSRYGGTWLTAEQLKEAAKSLQVGVKEMEPFLVHYKQKDYYSTRSLVDAENKAAVGLMGLLHNNAKKTVDHNQILALVHKFEQEENGGYKLHEHQVDAVIMVVENALSILTGGPGTGKTTVLRCIAYVLRAIRKETSIVYTAPTGKAARRITESTGEVANTTHRKLGLGRDGEAVRLKLVTEDVFLIDESSMVDIKLLACISDAVKGNRKLVFVGDVDQLPSVSYGAVLRDLIESDVIPKTMLTKTFRQDNSSVLFKNISAIRTGSDELTEGEDFKCFKLETGNQQDTAVEKTLKAYKKAVEKYGIDNVCCLMPYRKSGTCSNLMNTKIQEVVNFRKEGYRSKDNEGFVRFFKVDDPVMQLENRGECANGDVGKIIEISAKGVVVQYIDDTVEYAPTDLCEITLAYAMSIHKSQGSEYAAVIMCLLDEHTSMLQRNLIYTGITRAKKECTLIYQEHALKTAVSTVAEDSRLTLLADKLRTLDIKYRYTYGEASVA